MVIQTINIFTKVSIYDFIWLETFGLFRVNLFQIFKVNLENWNLLFLTSLFIL
jgi:hypothetical protein